MRGPIRWAQITRLRIAERPPHPLALLATSPRAAGRGEKCRNSSCATRRRGCEMARDEYLALRRQYEPKPVRLVIVAESPPASGKYFYNAEGLSTGPLFTALMRQLDFVPTVKRDGLTEFQRRGWVLIDATYKPVDKFKNNADRSKIIEQDYEQLRADLVSLIFNRSVPLILIKKNVCRILEPKLREDGFNVLNGGRVVYFPGSGRQGDFHRQFGAILKSARI